MYEGIPDFPDEAGEDAAIEFVKDGARYRLLRIDADTLVIHQSGRTREQFELVLHNFTRGAGVFDVAGQGEVAHVTALGASRGVLSRLF